MTHARRYLERPPRYVLNPLDQSMMRFKENEPGGIAVRARVVNISETGLSFEMSGPDLPYVDEILKIEFTIPGQRQIACFANVVRIEPRKAWHPLHGERFTMKIGLRFHELPDLYKRALKKSLDERVAREEEFDDAGEISMVTRAIHFSLATAGLLMLFVTMQVAPVQLIETLFK
jgi:hypothetical protein